MGDYPYVWSWRWRTWQFPDITFKAPWFGDGVDRKGMRCRVVTRGSMNSALVRFEDGYEVVTSRGGLRKAKTSHRGADVGAASPPASADATRRVPG